MPDDNVSVPNPASIATPSLPTVEAPSVPGVDTVNAPASVPDVAVPSAPSPVAGAEVPGATGAADASAAMAGGDPEVQAEVARKIGEAHNVLVALSSDPSVDEMAAAIGLSLYLDKLGKRATAIYSGQTPNALEFLKPEETFEDSVDTLQDFVIALNKEKADHLRYKLDGDFVKIYITPYKSKISEEDLEFSYGDYNVDLVLALDVANGVDLDAALREHGRIMHDAVIINITTGNPGKLGEIEWSDKTASSVSEMIARLLYSVKSDVKIEKEEATAFLTGIVAATNRFSNAGTTPDTMRMASKLMESGANQQLVSKNITPDIDNEMIGLLNLGEATRKDDDPTKLDIEHGNEKDVDETKVVGGTVTEKESTLLDDLKAAEASLASAGAETTPEVTEEPLKIDSATESESLPEVADEVKKEAEEVASAVAEAEKAAERSAENSVAPESLMTPAAEDENETKPADENGGFISEKPEKVLQPSSDFSAADGGEDASKYGQMLEDALESVGGGEVEPAAAEPVVASATEPVASVAEQPVASVDNPAVASAPAVGTNPEINGVPEINYMPMPGDEVLPPPPAPPIDMGASEPVATDAAPASAPVEPVSEPASLGAQPVMQDQVYAPQAADPGAFKIPGM